MKKRFYFSAIISVVFALPALAQETRLVPPASATPAPAAAVLAMPQASLDSALGGAQASTTGSSAFPTLPPSHACGKGDILGLWKLFQLYEDPSSVQMANFNAQPYQYILFTQDSLFRKYSNAKDPGSMDGLRSGLLKQQTPLQQYVINDAGIIYFYNDSVAVDNLACFIVANSTNKFAAGQMLIMPPMGQATTHWVRVYQNMLVGDAVPPAVNQAQPRKGRR